MSCLQDRTPMSLSRIHQQSLGVDPLGVCYFSALDTTVGAAITTLRLHVTSQTCCRTVEVASQIGARSQSQIRGPKLRSCNDLRLSCGGPVQGVSSARLLEVGLMCKVR